MPLLGNTYIDLERRAKIDEAVYEVLTKQYELARVDEAKEIATAKVLDPADLPEKKSFPPRLLLAILAGFPGLVGSISLVLLRKAWHDLDPDDPKKRFGNEVRRSLRLPRWRRSDVRKGSRKLMGSSFESGGFRQSFGPDLANSGIENE